jgi:hypothetical protein
MDRRQWYDNALQEPRIPESAVVVVLLYETQPKSLVLYEILQFETDMKYGDCLVTYSASLHPPDTYCRVLVHKALNPIRRTRRTHPYKLGKHRQTIDHTS